MIDIDGQLGTIVSSRRFKNDVRPMDQTSEAIHLLKPVTFHYKSDKTGTLQFGLIAEEVAEVDPNLVVRDDKGEIFTVRYDAVNAMLLNEFLKAHRKMEEQACEIERQNAAMTELRRDIETILAHSKQQDLQIQTVRDQVQMNTRGAQIAANNQ
jgi:hypothetical protein